MQFKTRNGKKNISLQKYLDTCKQPLKPLKLFLLFGCQILSISRTTSTTRLEPCKLLFDDTVYFLACVELHNRGHQTSFQHQSLARPGKDGSSQGHEWRKVSSPQPQQLHVATWNHFVYCIPFWCVLVRSVMSNNH